MADVKISALPAASGVTADDLIPIVNDPAGSPATQKATAAQLAAYMVASGGAAAAVAEGRIALSGTTHLRIPGVSCQSISALTFGAGQLFYMPFLVATPIQVDAMAVEVTTLQAGNNIRLGIYNADTSWQPTTLVIDAGLIDTGSNGVKLATFTAVALAAGRYLMAYHSNNATVAVRVLRGDTHLAGVNAAMGTSPFIERLSKTTPFAVLADPGVAWDTLTNGGANAAFDYLCLLRVSVP